MSKRLTSAALVKKLHQYNQLSILLTVIFTLGSILFWIVSYLIPTWIVSMLFEVFITESPAPWIQPTIVGLFLFLLILEMWRERDGLFDLREFHNSEFDFGTSVAYMQRSGIDHGMGHLMAATHLAWIMTQLLLIAPHTTMLAIRRWRSRVVVKEDVAESAVKLYYEMAKKLTWVPRPRGRKQELAYLDRAGLLWSRQEGKLAEVQTLRYEPPQKTQDWFEKA